MKIFQVLLYRLQSADLPYLFISQIIPESGGVNCLAILAAQYLLIKLITGTYLSFPHHRFISPHSHGKQKANC